MEIIKNDNAKQPYYFKVYQAQEITITILRELLQLRCDNGDRQHEYRKRLKTYRIGDGKYTKGVYDIAMSFDIETTTVETSQPYATMYIWQMGINKNVIIGRTWQQFIYILDLIKQAIKPTKNQRLFCFIHNASFEFQFMRKWINVTDAFLKEQRTLLYIEHDNFIQFRDSYAMTQQSLKKLAETYTNTQKCTGDLDYTIVRHFATEGLTDTELMYCYNDVLILNEYFDYYSQFLQNKFAPLTATAVLNKEVQDGFKECSEEYKRFIKNSHPKTEQDYNWLMGSVYRGGYVHGNELYIDDLFTINDNIYGVDFTSSYPSVMLFMKYGYRFRKAKATTIDDILAYINDDYAVLFEAEFYDIKRKGLHSIESVSKCIDIVNCCYDNGRVASASYMRVALTCQDLLSYLEFYEWDTEKTKVLYCEIAQKEYLPSYLTQPLLKYYTTKNALKNEGKDDTIEYALAKAKVNSFYGLTVKMLPNKRVTYDNTGWGVVDAKAYEKCKDNGLLPYFGVYVSSYARRNLLMMVNRLEKGGYPCLYMDTDSIKIMGFDDGAKAIIEDYNKHIKKLCSEAKKRLKTNDLIDGLGEFDAEYGEGTKHGQVEYFKMQGAKRYIITTVKGYKNQTIAGLPKNILFENHTTQEVFDMFTDDMAINDCKLMAVYNDEETHEKLTDCNGKTVEIYEKSSVALVDTDFTMKIKDLWLQDILRMKQEEELYYNRQVKGYNEW